MRRIILVLSLAISIGACQTGLDPEKEILAAMDQLEEQMLALNSIDTVLAADMLGVYNKFLDLSNNDSISPIVRKKIAELYRAWPNKQAETIASYQDLIEKHTYHEEGKRAIISLALYYEEKGLKDEAMAQYQHFVENFPSHPLADQARQLSEMLANEKVSDIELVQEWMRKAKSSGEKE